MKFYHKFLLVAYLGILLGGCSEKVYIDIPEHEITPVLNCLFKAGSNFSVYLGLTSDMNSSAPVISEATVTLWVNGEMTEELIHKEKGMFISEKTIAEESTKYQIKAFVPGYDTLYASDIIPKKINLFSIEFYKNGGYDVNDDIRYPSAFVGFIDDAKIENFFQVSFYNQDIEYKYKNPYTSNLIIIDSVFQYQNVGILKSESSVILSEGVIGETENCILFSDKLINTDTCSIKLDLFNPSYKYPDKRYPGLFCVLKTVSGNYYNYTQSLSAHLYNQDLISLGTIGDLTQFIFTGEPNNVYSNIENGTGIFAGYTESILEAEIMFQDLPLIPIK